MAERSRLVAVSRWLILGLFATYVVLSLDWRPHYTAQTPEITDVIRASGAVQAGAAKATLVPTFPAPIGGYNTRSNAPFEGVEEPIFARALVIQVADRRIGFVSVELVTLPASIRDKVLAAVKGANLEDLFIGATHTHSGLGGYWDKRIAEWGGVGTYDPKIEAFLVGQIATALKDAVARLKPARIASGDIEASNYQMNRSDPSLPTDKTMTAVRVDALDGSRIARVIIYAVHPTISPRDGMKLSGDWPGVMMSTLEADGAPALFFQGAGGDVTWGKRAGTMTLEERVVRFGRAVSGDAEGALAAGGDGEGQVKLAIVHARLTLPPADASAMVPLAFERLASNILQWLLRPGATEVSYLHIGPMRWACVPGEPVSQLGIEWSKALGGATIVGLMNDYIGYVETPERIQAKQGEAIRSYFGAPLAPLLLEGLEAARTTADR